MNKIKEKIKGMTVKSFFVSMFEFYNKNLKKTFLVLLAISLILVAIGVPAVVQILKADGGNEKIITDISFFNIYSANVQIVFFIVLAGIVPYIYVPVVGIFAGFVIEVSKFAMLIVNKGYMMATLTYIVPLILNICIINMAIALGMYMCRTITAKYRFSNVNSMNLIKFRIDLYDMLKQEDKKNALEKKREEKIATLEKKDRKLNYFQIVSITVMLFVFQIIASLLEMIIIY